MSQTQLKALFSRVRHNPELQNWIKAAKSPEDDIAIAKEHGCELASLQLRKLNESELDNVTGGKIKKENHAG